MEVRVLKHPGRKWLLVTSEENYLICLDCRRWGDENYCRISQIKPGDILIFYIKVAQLGAVAEATKSVYHSSEVIWPDRLYPYRIDFSVLIDPGLPIDFRPLIPLVSFLPRKDKRWGAILQTSCLEISDSDAQLLINAIKQGGISVWNVSL
ncbi:hypothetical protein [Thermoflexus sp.]|uniref:hypothetical protein n=1 Tax=Thermoflexus sp. TaxID=1969742 RepID=UPI0035E3F8AB